MSQNLPVPSSFYSNENNASNSNVNDIAILTDQLINAQQQIGIEKAGKRKLFRSLVKIANELRSTRSELKPLLQQLQYDERNWYDGGMWRAPSILPAVNLFEANNSSRTSQSKMSVRKNMTRQGLREAVSLSDLFFNLVIVTAFTRVGVGISSIGYLDFRSVVYFGLFWTIWSKEASYGTRFDTSDLSATVSTLLTCFAVLFGSLSVQAPMESDDGTRIMIMAASVSAINCWLHIRVALTNWSKHRTLRDQQDLQTLSSNTMSSTGRKASGVRFSSATLGGENSTMFNNDTLTNNSSNNNNNNMRQRSESIASSVGGGIGSSSLLQHVVKYAVLNIIMTTLECAVWIIGIMMFPVDYKYRWCFFLAGFLLGQRFPRAFLSNDFHAACSKRGVLFILLLGFLLQSIVVTASEFFAYQTPNFEQYSFIGSACLMFFCIKLLYVSDSATLTHDHALLVNRWAAFIFNAGQFGLLLSTTVMGSGLNLLTHEYMAATAALPGPAKTLVCGGFSAVLFSTFLIKSMHVKRIPTDKFNQSLFVGAYVIQTVVLLLVVGVTAAMSIGYVGNNGFIAKILQYESVLLFVLSGAAFVVVLLCWLDEAVELILYESAADSRQFLVHPFGIWWCLASDVTEADRDDSIDDFFTGGDASSSRRFSMSSNRLSVLRPLLGSSIANMKDLWGSTNNLNYQSFRNSNANLAV